MVQVGQVVITKSGSYAPGSTFTADLAPDTERFLTQIGAIVEMTSNIPDAVFSEPVSNVAPSQRLLWEKEKEE